MGKRYIAIFSAARRAIQMIRTSPIVRDPRTRQQISSAARQLADSNHTMNPNYTWTYHIDVPPYDRLVNVLEAFFASLPAGDYSCEHRESYKLDFRRGAWRKSLMGLGRLVPDRLVKGDFKQWPIMIRLLVRPSPEVFSVTIHYDLYLPSEVRSLNQAVQSSVDQHARAELEQLTAYLAECISLDEPPHISS